MFILEMSLSKPVQVRQPARACYCPRCRLRHRGQSGATAQSRQVGTSQRCLSKAQTSFWLPRVRPRGYLKIDQGRSLLRAPQRCLSFKLPLIERASQATRLNEERDLVSEPLQYTEALELTSSRSSDYSLVKELSQIDQTSAGGFHRPSSWFPGVAEWLAQSGEAE